MKFNQDIFNMDIDMKCIKEFKHPKYNNDEYNEIELGIYKYEDIFVASMSFAQETAFGEGENASDISQYPLEDILDEYGVFVSDFYSDLNVAESETCYIEFASDDINDVRHVKSLAGKHVYNKTVKENNQIVVKLIVE